MSRFGVREVADVTFYNIDSGKPELFLDTLKMTNLENTAETSYARGGKGNPRLLAWDYNRESTMTIQDALLTPRSLGIVSGKAVQSGSTEVYKRERLEVDSDYKIELDKEPIEDSVYVYISNDGYEHEEELTKGDSSNTGEFDLNEKEITLNEDDVSEGDKVLVYYKYETDDDAITIKINSDTFPGYYLVIGDTVVRNEKTGEDEPFQLIIPKAKVQAEFNIEMEAGGDPAVFDFNLDIFKSDEDTNMVKMVKY